MVRKIAYLWYIENQWVIKLLKIFVKKLLKKFANQKNCRNFASGLRKWGSLNRINLLVISFSVINYVVSESVRLWRPTLFFLCPFLGFSVILQHPAFPAVAHTSYVQAVGVTIRESRLYLMSSPVWEVGEKYLYISQSDTSIHGIYTLSWAAGPGTCPANK